MTQQENIFGKIRGRWDEDRARSITRTMPDRAIAFCAAMDDEQFVEFVARFNKIFDRPGPAKRYQISGHDDRGQC